MTYTVIAGEGDMRFDPEACVAKWVEKVDREGDIERPLKLTLTMSIKRLPVTGNENCTSSIFG